MDDRHYFDYSQGTFGGGLACCCIATLTACSFADGEIKEDNYKKYCRVGSDMWKKLTHGMDKTSAKDLIDSYEFFKDTYEVEEYQGFCNFELDGKISLNNLLTVLEKENKDRSYGIVFTDNVISFSVGKFFGSYVIFDSHAPKAWIKKCDPESIEEEIKKNFVSSNIFDATTIVKKI